MNCEEFKKNLDCFVDGQLSEDLKIKAQRHIEECAKCRNLYYCEKRIKNLVQKSVNMPSAPPSLCNHIKQLLATQDKERQENNLPK